MVGAVRGGSSGIVPPVWLAIARCCDGNWDLEGVARPWTSRDNGSQILVVIDHLPVGWIHLGADRPTVEAVRQAAETLPLAPPLPTVERFTTGPLASTTLIVCTRGRPQLLRNCLESVALGIDPDVKVLVVDSCPTGSENRLVVADMANRLDIEVISERRAGLSRARNAGLRRCETELAAFIDDDVLVEPGWLTPLRRAFGSGPDVGLVVGLVPPAQLDTPEQVFFESRVPWSRSVSPRRLSLSDPDRPERPFPYNAGQIGAGANMAIRLDVIDRLGGFDTALGAGSWVRGGEDLEMYVRVLRGGYAIHFEPSSIVWHLHASNRRALRRQVFGYGTGASGYLACVLTRPGRLDVLRSLRALWGAAVEAREGTLANGRTARTQLVEIAGLALGPLLFLAERVRAAVRSL